MTDRTDIASASVSAAAPAPVPSVAADSAPAPTTTPRFDWGLFKLAALCTVVFGLAAHAYCYFNMTLSHDALFSLYRQDLVGQVQLGRFMHVPYHAVRGFITAPALIGALSLAFLSMAAYLTLRVTEITSKPLVVLVCGILATNATLTLTNASYLHESDQYMLALLLACAAVWCWRNLRFGWAAGGVLLALSLGFYQAYLSVAAVLFIMLALMDAARGTAGRELGREIGSMLGTLALGFALYLVLMFGFMAVYGVGFSSGENGLEQAGNFAGTSVVSLVAHTWLMPLHTLVRPIGLYPQLVGVLNVALSLVALVGLFWLARRHRVPRANYAVMVVLLLLLPFAANYVYVLSKGYVHALMLFAFFYWYVFALQVQQRVLDEKGWQLERLAGPAPKLPAADARLAAAGAAIVCAICAVVIAFNVVYANQAYFKKELQFEATQTTVNRVIDRLEQLERYEPGETPVYFTGSLQESPLLEPRAGFEHLNDTGFWSEAAVTYDVSAYMEEVLGYPVNLLAEPEAAALLPASALDEMGAFPSRDSVQMVNGVAVVRLS